jgi:quinol-cytochrome oxidoreductase complex cytochrome b subunit
MTHEKFAALIAMLVIAVSVVGLTPPWSKLPKWGRIALAVVAALFGLPPLIGLWITGVF